MRVDFSAHLWAPSLQPEPPAQDVSLPAEQVHSLEADSLQYQFVQSLSGGSTRQLPSHAHTGRQRAHDGAVYVRRSQEERVMGLAALWDYLCSISADNWGMTTEIESLNQGPQAL